MKNIFNGFMRGLEVFGDDVMTCAVDCDELLICALTGGEAFDEEVILLNDANRDFLVTAALWWNEGRGELCADEGILCGVTTSDVPEEDKEAEDVEEEEEEEKEEEEEEVGTNIFGKLKRD